MLAVYFEQNVTTSQFEDYDGKSGMMAFNKLFGKFKKSEVEDEEEIKVQDYLDMIAPSTIRFYTEYFICGNSYRSVWALREYPTSTDEQALFTLYG